MSENGAPAPISDATNNELLAELKRRGLSASASIGPPMTPADEAAHRARLAQLHADEAEQAIGLRAQTVKDLQASLKEAKTEAKRLRAEADHLSAEAEKGGQ